MQSQIRAQTGVGTANPVVINTNVSPVNLGIVVVVTGTVTYTVNHTYDSPAGFSTWLPDAVLVSKTANSCPSNESVTAPGLTKLIKRPC